MPEFWQCATNRKRIRGLWQRNDQYYLQVRIAGEAAPRKFPLKAKVAMESKRTELRDGKVPNRGHKPTFAACADEYLRMLENAERHPKGPRPVSTVQRKLVRRYRLKT